MTKARRPDVVVVTGTGGMGRAIARRIGSGRPVVLAERDEAQLVGAAKELESLGYDVHAMAVDISNRADVDQLADRAARLGPIGPIAHTAGVSPVQATAAEIVSVDLVGTAHVLEAFEPHVGPTTVAVCVTSMAGTMTNLDADSLRALAVTPAGELGGLDLLDVGKLDSGTAYGIAKRANQVRVVVASVAWGARGGRVVSVSPGVVATPMGRSELDGEFGAVMRAMVDDSGTGRLGTPDDVAAAVDFLASPAASFITGTDLLVDGGAVAALRGAGAVHF